MFNKKDIPLILNKIKQHYKFKNNVEFANYLGISPQTLSNWYSRGTLDFDLVYTKCLGISGDWLLSGKGEMLINDTNTPKTNEVCQACVEKERTITALQESNNLLKEKVESLKEKISALESRPAPATDSYRQTA